MLLTLLGFCMVCYFRWVHGRGCVRARHIGDAVDEHERVSSACSRLKASARIRTVKDVIMSSVVPGAAVVGFGFAAAAYGGPVVWAAFWGAVLIVISRA